MKQNILKLMPYIFWSLMVIVTVLMLVELQPSEAGWPYWDKVQHFIVFTVLTLTGVFATGAKAKWAYAGLIVYGALIEWLQSALTVTRIASVQDWLADVAGIVIVFILLAFLRAKKT